MRRFLARFGRDEHGATAIEYGLIVALIVVVVIGVLTALSQNFNGVMDAVGRALGA